MSADLYWTRVYFGGRGPGVVKVAGPDGVVLVMRKLPAPPEIPGLPTLEAIDFAAETQTYELTPTKEARREMFGSERTLVNTWLRSLAKGLA